MEMQSIARGAHAAARLMFAGLCALAGYLALFRAPTYRLWMLAVGVTEWGYWMAPLVLAPLFRAWRRALGFPGWLLGALAGLLMLTPVARAFLLARKLPQRVERAFGAATPQAGPDAPARPQPLVWLDLLRGVPLPPVQRETMAFQAGDGTALRLELYRPRTLPDTGAGLPLVIVIHGGAWESGDPDQLPEVNRYLAARGYAVAAVTYRLAPQHRFPAALDDVLAAIEMLRGRAGELGLDGGRIALYGRSAGGHLALLAGSILGEPAIRAVAALYPPTDLRWGHANPAPRRVIDSTGVLERFLGGGPEAVSSAYDAATPLMLADASAPPTLLGHGRRDELASPVHSRRMAEHLRALDRPHLLLELPWATHGFEANLAGPGGQLWLYALERFLAATV
jgi:acetyl esterase/lipase